MSRLPSSLTTKLDQFQRTWYRLHSFTLLALAVLLPGVTFLLFVCSERLWNTPAWMRVLFLLPVPVLLAWIGFAWWKRWIWKKPDARELARTMGRLDPRVGDQLLGAVELAEDSEEQSSAVLREAALKQVADGLKPVTVEDRLDRRRLRRTGLGTCVVLLVVLVGIGVAPEAIKNSLHRWIQPTREIERFTFTRLSGFPDHLRVVHGEDYSFSGRVSSFDGEATARMSVKSSGPESVNLERGLDRVLIQGSGITEKRSLKLKAGDASATVELEPVFRPELTKLNASIRFPDYMGRDPVVKPISRNRLELPEGSRLGLEAQISRTLASVQDASLGSVAFDGATFQFEPVEVQSNQTVRLSWVDEFGFGPKAPFDLKVELKPDHAPVVSLDGIAPAIALMPHEFVKLSITATDDYGVEFSWLQVESKRGDQVEQYQEDLTQKGERAENVVMFSPERWGLQAGSDLTLRAWAVDAYPNRSPVSSDRYRILVMSREDHAKLVRQQMENVLSDLDELVRDEAAAIEENRMLQARSDEDLGSEVSAEDVRNQQQDEESRVSRLDESREKLRDILQEAKRNDSIEDATVKEWAEVEAQLSLEAGPAMKAAAEAMKQAGSGPQSAAQRREQLAKAEQAQQKAMDAMKQSEREMEEAIQMSIARNFVNRFRELAKQESAIAATMQKLLPLTIGLTAEELPDQLRGRVEDQLDSQVSIRKRTGYLHGDLNGFYRRTQSELHKEIAADMLEEKFNGRLSELESFIRRNVIGKTTTECLAWAELFTFWADTLEEDVKARQQSGGGSGGGGEAKSIDMETLVALVRARERQENLREHTRVLDEGYEDNPNYHREATKLSDRQYELSKTLQPLENSVEDLKVRQFISIAAGEIMNAGVFLRRPQTDQETVDIQTAVIEMIAQALQQGMQGGSSSQQQQMQAAMAAMGMGEGSSGTGGGGSSAGGDDSGETSQGAMRNRADASEGGKAGAAELQRWPSEYRNLMDAYYQALENAEQ